MICEKTFGTGVGVIGSYAASISCITELTLFSKDANPPSALAALLAILSVRDIPASKQFPGGVSPCQPGLVIPIPGSVTTDCPSVDTVAVPSMTSIPVV